MKNKQYLCERVIEEATALKQFATKEELSKVYTGLINPYDPRKCIYGLMTGSCDSERAMNLFHECAVKGIATSVHVCGRLPYMNDYPFEYSRYYQSPLSDGNLFTKGSFSPIEVFIAHCNDQDLRILVDYIKDEIKDGDLNYYDFQFFHD